MPVPIRVFAHESRCPACRAPRSGGADPPLVAVAIGVEGDGLSVAAEATCSLCGATTPLDCAGIEVILRAPRPHEGEATHGAP